MVEEKTTSYSTDKFSADELQSKTNIPVVAIGYGKEAAFDDALYSSLEVIGKIIDNENRSKEVVNYMKDREKLLKWNPDKIFIDQGGLQVVKEDYKKNPNYYNNLSAVKNGELYSQMSYNSYSTNIGTAMADAYYIGKVLYPEKFKDIDPEKKADEIYKSLLGKELYSEMAKNLGGFKKITLK